MIDPAVFAQFRLEAWEAELVGAEPARTLPSPVSRIDAFFDQPGRTFRVTEYNAETPAGTAYGDALSDIFLSLPCTREFLRTHLLWTLPARHHVLHALLDAWEAWSGTRNRPVIAIVDWHDVPTYSEFVLFDGFFREQGFESQIVDPAECEYTEGRLSARGRPIDLIYKRVLITELVERAGLGHAIIRAVRDAVPRHIPVVGNGDVVDIDGWRRMVDQTGCDAVMIGRGAQGNPWLFRRIRELAAGRPDPGPPTLDERVAAFRRHVELIFSLRSGPKVIHEIRKACAWYARGLRGVNELRQRVWKLSDPQAAVAAAEACFAALSEHERGRAAA